MGEFLAFVMIVFAAVWGSVFLAAYAKRFGRELDGKVDDAFLGRLREDSELLERRVERLEEELQFFKELHAPEAPPVLEPPEADDAESP